MNKNTGKAYTKTGFNHGARRAGAGVAHDNYDDESGYRGYSYRYDRPRFPNDGVKPEELNGPCVIVQPAKQK